MPGLSTIWPVLAALAAASSLALLITFWDTRLLIGVAIDVVIVALAVVRPEWIEF